MDFSNIVDTEMLIAAAIAYTPKILAAMTLFIAFIYVYKFTRKPMHQLLQKLDLEEPIRKLMIDSVFKWCILIFGGLMALKQLGIDVGAVLAGLGVAGIAIGFAAQDSISNVISGFIIFLDKPFKVGDWVKTGDHFGKVWEITMRSTRIQTMNHTYVIIPNKTIIDETLENHSKYGDTRIELHIGIAYKESIVAARKALLQAVDTIDILLKNPAPDVVVKELGDSSVNLVVRVWVDNAEKEKRAYYQTMEACKIALDEAGIEIPFPHLQLFLDDVKQDAVTQLQKALSTK